MVDDDTAPGDDHDGEFAARTAEVGSDVSDEELTVLALGADPGAPLADDAVPFVSDDDLGVALLPEWYMPAASLRHSTPRAIVLAAVAVALLVVNIAGVCVTYGIPDPVWK